LFLWSRRRRYSELEFTTAIYGSEGNSVQTARRPIVIVGKLPAKYILERMVEDIFKNKVE
jgi:hypothetical protein